MRSGRLPDLLYASCNRQLTAITFLFLLLFFTVLFIVYNLITNKRDFVLKSHQLLATYNYYLGSFQQLVIIFLQCLMFQFLSTSSS